MVVLFGGRDASGNKLDDTWTWDGSSWTPKSPTHSPPALQSTRMVYDANTSYKDVVLFGGTKSNGTASSDTWIWDGTDWTQKNPNTTPAARSSEGLAYDGSTDATGGQVLMFGGDVATGTADPFGETTSATPRSDTWAWTGTDWSLKTPTLSPSARESPSMSYSSSRNAVVLFGGRNGTTYYQDTWTWSGTNWANPLTTGPSNRYGQRQEFDTKGDGTHRVLVLFGGYDGTNLKQDTWTLDGGSWNQLTPATSPGVRCCYGFAVNPATNPGNVLVLFGGAYLSGGTATMLGDTWTWNGTTWSCALGSCT